MKARLHYAGMPAGALRAALEAIETLKPQTLVLPEKPTESPPWEPPAGVAPNAEEEPPPYSPPPSMDPRRLPR